MEEFFDVRRMMEEGSLGDCLPLPSARLAVIEVAALRTRCSRSALYLSGAPVDVMNLLYPCILYHLLPHLVVSKTQARAFIVVVQTAAIIVQRLVLASLR